MNRAILFEMPRATIVGAFGSLEYLLRAILIISLLGCAYIVLAEFVPFFNKSIAGGLIWIVPAAIVSLAQWKVFTPKNGEAYYEMGGMAIIIALAVSIFIGGLYFYAAPMLFDAVMSFGGKDFIRGAPLKMITFYGEYLLPAFIGMGCFIGIMSNSK